MCGIAGIIGIDGNPLEAVRLTKMCEVIAHRGPDDFGYLAASLGRGSSRFTDIRDITLDAPCDVLIGHRRLSVIDLSPEAANPISNGDNTIHLVYNGETYNYRELRAGLVDKAAAEIITGGWKFGNTSHNTEFESDGTIKFNGDATVWNDFVVELSSAKIPAANAPNWAKVADDGSGSTGVYAWHFDDGEYIEFHIQMPHDWKEGSTIYPHVHFECTSDVDPTDKFDLELEYFWVDIGEDRPANTTLENRECETGVNTDTQHQIVNIPENGIDGTGHTISSILICRLERVAAASDNYADQIIIYDADVHYEVDSIGSRGVTSK